MKTHDVDFQIEAHRDPVNMQQVLTLKLAIPDELLERIPQIERRELTHALKTCGSAMDAMMLLAALVREIERVGDAPATVRAATGAHRLFDF